MPTNIYEAKHQSSSSFWYNNNPRATEIEKVVLKKTVMPVKILEDGLTGSENLKTRGGEKQNFKDKLSKF